MGVRTSDIQVNIKVRGQRIDNLFPAFDLLNFVEKKIGLSICGELRFELCIHLFRRHIRILHRIIAAVDNAFNRNVPLGFQLFRNHFQDRGFSAATHASQDFYERGIGVCHDLVYI